MLRVDLIYSRFLDSPDGASRFVKTMKAQKDLFAEYGIELQVFTPDLFSHRSFCEGSIEKPSMLKRIVRTLSRYSVFFTKCRVHRAYELPAKNILEYYDGLPDKGQVVTFQESFTAYAFLKHYKNCNQKVILSLHLNGELWGTMAQSMPRINSLLLRGYRSDIERTLIGGCDRIGFVADMPRKHFCKTYGYNEENTFYVYNGIASTPFFERPVHEKLDLICVGSLTKNKNQGGVLNAISSLPVDYQKKITFTIVGDGIERQFLEEKAGGVAAEILFTGSSQKVSEYLKKANCYVLFSKSEGLPISIIEGMRAGLPILGTNVGGIPEQILDGKSGFILNVDETQLVEKLKYLVDNLGILTEMGKSSYDLFRQRFTLETMVRNYSEIYKSL